MDKLVAVFVLVALVFGALGCALEDGLCGDTHAAGESATAHHCVVHCACHELSLAPANLALACEDNLRWCVLAKQQLKLRLFAAAIFNPPKA